MKRIIKLTESDLVHIVKKIISEQTNTDDVEEAFNDALDTIKEGGDVTVNKIDYDNIQDVVTKFVVEFVLELTTKRNQNYVRYIEDDEWLSDEEFDEAFEKVMSDFKEHIVSLYPEIKAHVDDKNKRQRTDYKTRRRMFNKPNYTELQGDDEDEEGITIEDDEIIQMIMNSESEIDQEDYDDVYDWMLVIFSDVESQLTDMGVDDDIVDDIRMKYDDVLMSIWRGGNDN